MCVFMGAGLALGTAIGMGSGAGFGAALGGLGMGLAGIGGALDSRMTANAAADAQWDAQHTSYMRKMEMNNMNDAFAMGQFRMQMEGQMIASSMDNQKFMLNAQHQMEDMKWDFDNQMRQLQWDVDEQANSLERSYDQEWSQLRYADDAIKNAFDAFGIDMSLLGDQMNQSTVSAIQEKFERLREQKREEAKMRVSQGESGMFGNTAGREVMASLMDAQMDNAVTQLNLKNYVKQSLAQGKKLGATYKGRENEAVSKSTYMRISSMNSRIMEA